MKLTIGRKIGFGFGLVILLAFFNFYLTYNTLNKHKEISIEVTEVSGPSVEILEKFHLMVIRSKMLISYWVLTKSSEEHPNKKKLKEILLQDYPVIKSQVKLLSDKWDEDNKNNTITILQKVDTLLSEHHKVIQALHSPESYDNEKTLDYYRNFVEKGPIEKLTNEVLYDLDVLLDEQKNHHDISNIELRITSDSLQETVLITGILLIVFGVLIAFFTVRTIVKPTYILRNIILKMAKGVLPDHKIKETSDEIGEMSKATNALIKGLKHTTRFSEAVGAGNFTSEYQPLSKDDTLGYTLLKMRENLAESERNLEKNVALRTEELQKASAALEESIKEVEKKSANLQALNAIGDEISSSLKIDTITYTSYESINFLMGASSFGIGIYNLELNRVDFEGFIEKGEKLPNHYYSMDDNSSLSVWSLKNNKAVYINNYEEEYQQYIPDSTPPNIGEKPSSVIYIPLLYNERPIGVVTIQSLKKNAYSPYEFSLLKNLATHIATAIDKANSYKIIHKKNREILESIQYAKRIQTAILPQIEKFKNVFPYSFIIYRPKDVVSGDFYYFTEEEGKYIIGAFDCTGHGIPGGFMSMIGYALLNQVILTNRTTQPAKILNRLDKEVVKGLRQDQIGSDSKDGMDAVICSIDLEKRTLEAAGAHNSLYLFNEHRPEKMITLKADRLSIGGMIDKEKVFTNHKINLIEGDTIYMFSDGFHDQFGGARNRKYMIRRLREFLGSIQNKSMEEQKNALEKEFNDWKGDLSQIDDILMMGVRISFA